MFACWWSPCGKTRGAVPKQWCFFFSLPTWLDVTPSLYKCPFDILCIASVLQYSWRQIEARDKHKQPQSLVHSCCADITSLDILSRFQGAFRATFKLFKYFEKFPYTSKHLIILCDIKTDGICRFQGYSKYFENSDPAVCPAKSWPDSVEYPYTCPGLMLVHLQPIP